MGNLGKKVRIDFSKLDNYLFNEVKYLFMLYKWVYSDNNSDRISILKNIITIFLCGECTTSYYTLLLRKSREIYKSVLNNFDIYLKENVKTYFEDRHKVKEMITNKSKEITIQIGALLEVMSKNFLTTAGIILVAMIGYLTKADLQILKIAVAEYGLFIVVNGLYYFPFYLVKVIEINHDYYEHIETFRKTLIPADIPEDSRIKKTNIIFYVYWGTSIVISLIVLEIAKLFVFNTSDFICFLKLLLSMIK
jgi:hypothetical protein